MISLQHTVLVVHPFQSVIKKNPSRSLLNAKTNGMSYWLTARRNPINKGSKASETCFISQVSIISELSVKNNWLCVCHRVNAALTLIESLSKWPSSVRFPEETEGLYTPDVIFFVINLHISNIFWIANWAWVFSRRMQILRCEKATLFLDWMSRPSPTVYMASTMFVFVVEKPIVI